MIPYFISKLVLGGGYLSFREQARSSAVSTEWNELSHNPVGNVLDLRGKVKLSRKFVFGGSLLSLNLAQGFECFCPLNRDPIKENRGISEVKNI